MKTIFKGNPFSIVWNIIDRTTNHPFEFTGMKVEVGLYSDSFNFPLQSYNVNNGTITAGIEANTLPAGVFNIMCRYSTDHEQSYCTYRNAFQISIRPCHASEIVEIESHASHIDPSSEDPDAPDYSKCQLIAEELFGVKLHLPELTAHRAIADEHGNRIPDTYVTRSAVAEHIRQTYNQQFLENPPLITEGYITPEMLSEETRQMLEASGQEITNLPDGEDIASVNGVLKLGDKVHNPNSYSGMGRVYLRKNIEKGVNLLTQSMIDKPNTIYIIQYDYDLQGEEVTISEGCVLDFQGGSIENGTITLNKTKIIGDAKIRCNVIGTINPLAPIMADWFCLNELEDATDKIKMIFRLSYNSVNNTGWRDCVPIYFGASTYNTKESIIDSTVTAGKLTIFGNRATTFNHTGDTPLLNNLGYIGFATFYGITFKGNGTNTFSVMQGGGNGNAQSVYYKECRFTNWKTVASYTGGTMASEMTFDLCKINGCGNVGNPATLFIWDNPQSVNNRFICTDIESIYGTIFKLLSGANITIYQGSIILQSNKIEEPFCFISVPGGATPTNFGQNNMPNIIVNESRFELRGYGRLVDKREYTASLSACFENCGFGGYNITKDETVQTIHLNGSCDLLFNNCFNTTNFSCYSNSVNNNPALQIIRSDDYNFIQQLIDNLVIGSQVTNVSGRVNFIHTITGEKWIPYSQSVKKSVTLRGAIEISEFLSTSDEHNTVFISPIYPNAANIVFNKDCYITGLSLMSNSISGWGDSVISVDVSLIDVNDSEQSVLKTNITVSKGSENNAYIPVPKYIKAIKLTCSLSNGQLTAAFTFKGFLKITHI